MALLRSREAVIQRFRAVLSGYDLTEQQWRILRALDGQDLLEIAVLAEKCQISLPSISGILKRLESRGLIERRSSPSDGRVTQVILTSNSKALIVQIKPEILNVYAQVEALLGPEKLAQLYSLLETLEGSLGQP